MFIFKCVNCGSYLQSGYGDIGELVECPACQFVQIIPEPAISSGGYFEEYIIRDLISSNLLWNSYHAQILQGRVLVDSVLKIPTGFFLKRVSSFKAFADAVKMAGNSGIKEFPLLTDSSITEGRSYFAYEYVKKLRTVSSFALDTPVREVDVLTVARKVAAALSEAWNKYKIPHLNLNPDSVRLVVSDLEVKIAGYGVSSFLASETRLLDDGLNIWDFRYVCPEFIRDGKCDSQALDIYSLGRLLCFMLSGVHPPEHDGTGTPAGDPLTAGLLAGRPGLSMSLVTLLNSMTEADPLHRISTWNEVIARIDAILAEMKTECRIIEYRRKFNIWKGYSGTVGRTKVHETLGLAAGRSEKKFHLAKPGRNLLLKTATGRMFAKDDINAVNRRWRMKRELSDAATWRVLAIFSMLLCVVAAVFLVNNIFFSSDGLPADGVQPPQVVPEAPSMEDAPAEPQVPAAPLPETGKQKTSPPPSSIQEKYAGIGDFLKDNPEGFDMAIRKYEELKRPYVLANDAKLVGDINERIFGLEKMKQAKVDETVSGILKSIMPFLEKNEKDNAVLFLDSYSGSYAAETKRQRKEIARKILDGLSIVEINRGEAVKLLDDVLEKNIKLIAAGDFDGTLSGLKELLKNPRDEMVGQSITSYIVDIGEFRTLRSDLQKKIISEKALRLKLGSKPEGDEFLLKALAYAELGDYGKAYENFEKMHYGTGIIFIGVFSELEAAAALNRLLEKYGIKYDAAQPDKLSEMLYKKQIDGVQAQKFMDDIRAFESDFSASQVCADNTLLLESLEKYAFSHFSPEQKKKEKEAASGKNTASNGRELLSMLEKADNFSTIYLKKGNYSLSAKDDNLKKNPERKPSSGSFNLGLTGIRLIGEEGVVFEDNITINAQSVEVSNIRMERGGLSILPSNISVLPNSGNILVKNCFFNDLETRIQKGVNISFDNCFTRGMIIEKSNNVMLSHCTIISQEKGLFQNAALWIDGGNLKVDNCIIYGDSLAVMFSDKGRRVSANRLQKDHGVTKESEIRTDRTIDIADTVFFGEQGLCSFQFENRPLKEEDVVKNPTMVSRYCNPKRNIYYPPQFVNSSVDNWMLVKGTPGYKGGSPKYKGGPLYYRNLKYAHDCGVIWPDPTGK
ncbi:MAG: hypothetical protein WAX69_23640 [Victivallales bacterium]